MPSNDDELGAIESRGSRSLNAPMQRWFIASGIGILPVLFVGMLMAHQVPPPSPRWNAVHIAHVFSQHPAVIEAGCLIMMVGFAVYGLYGAVITVWIWRMESRRYPLLTFASVIFLGAQLMAFEVGPLIWAVAAFRVGDLTPDIMLTLNDLAWFAFIDTWPLFAIWVVIVGIAILHHQGDPSYFPRWLGWLSIIVALTWVPIGLVGFEKEGPFAFDGILSFWFPLASFGVWELMIDFHLFKLIKNEEFLSSVGFIESEAIGPRSIDT